MFAHRIFSRAFTVRKWILIIPRIRNYKYKTRLNVYLCKSWASHHYSTHKYIFYIILFNNIYSILFIQYIYDVTNIYISQMTDHVSGQERLCLQKHVHEDRILTEGTCQTSCQEFEDQIIQMVEFKLWESVLHPLKKWKIWISSEEAKVSTIDSKIYILMR